MSDKLINFSSIWKFLKNTYVSPELLDVIDCESGYKIDPNIYIKTTRWEYRFDFEKLFQLWDQKATFIIHSSVINNKVKKLIESIEKKNDVDCQAHVYCGMMGSRSFSIHADNPDNLIIQCMGSSKVTIFNEFAIKSGLFDGGNLTIKDELILKPRDKIFIPSLRYHLFEPLSDRISISIPMYKKCMERFMLITDNKKF